MHLSKIYTASAFSVLVLTLAACGPGYTTQPYHGTPYGTRTAGSGVEYVRANLAAPKGIVDEQVTTNEAQTLPPPVPMIPSQRAETIFNDYQTKTKSFKLEILKDTKTLSKAPYQYNN